MSTPLTSSDETVFAAALERSPAERAAFLDSACAGDPARRARIESLLRAHAGAGEFLETPPDALATAILTQAALPADPSAKALATAEASLGDRIGRYKLLQKLGEGGCGTVWMAEQQEPVVRRVALKVIKLGMDTKEVIARFEAERQALALMDHPNIARVFDGGATDSGRPFFVMELVRGVPITKYCDEQNLPTAARLELFTAVCHAVQHAHQKGIIHRDLKPSNILVTLHDGTPVPKVIDFGIAKATQGRLTDATLFTAFEQFIGTPAYMSPEQAELSGLDIDTRSDIYSLGVLLYELLTGRPPFDPKTLVERGLDEIRRIIREVEPPRPSTRLSTLTDLEQATVAKLRGILPTQLSSLLRGDLDWIVMRCLEKDRTRRYDTPSALAADISHHLRNEAVAACPPNAAYVLKKFVRRNRVAVGTGAAVLVSLVVGLTVSLWQAVRATHAERRAQLEAATSEAVNRFFNDDVLGQASLSTQRAAGFIPLPALTVRQALQRTTVLIPFRFRDQPLVEAAVQDTIGRVYFNLGDFTLASSALERATGLQKLVLGDDHPQTLSTLRAFAAACRFSGRIDEALQHAEIAWRRSRDTLGARASATIASLATFAAVCEAAGDFRLAETHLHDLIRLERGQFGRQSMTTTSSLTMLGRILVAQEKFAEAERILREALAVRESLNPTDWRTANTRATLGSALAGQKRYRDAAALLTAGYEGMLANPPAEVPEYRLRLREALHHLIALHRAAGDGEQMARWQVRLQEFESGKP